MDRPGGLSYEAQRSIQFRLNGCDTGTTDNRNTAEKGSRLPILSSIAPDPGGGVRTERA